ncbi:hypothetical protein [Microbacterium sp. SORGH_AS_0888]|uniref:hypothetical protein n=1 Tax=Microbacterium sp. SORGH_AS_0888 TaxID=3041791 RepID=UPI00277FCD49|nr:hypothetical protein [Microbacterium sp. SORGH_AS_0888]MDQ1130248.1 hypothetical protein [Microbacterium sp. SORGH_AS_0888]
MTLVIFDQRDDSAMIVTDTLISDHNDQTPIGFASKVIPLPHLNLAMVSMGTSQFGWLWEDYVRRIPHSIRDIDDLNHTAPNVLRTFWTEYTAERGTHTDERICIIGYPDGSDKIVRYAYDSATNFEPERFDTPGMWTQPRPQTFTIDRWGDQDDIIDIATRFRNENPNTIGGHIHATIILNHQIRTTVIGCFPDHERCEDEDRDRSSPSRRVRGGVSAFQ